MRYGRTSPFIGVFNFLVLPQSHAQLCLVISSQSAHVFHNDSADIALFYLYKHSLKPLTLKGRAGNPVVYVNAVFDTIRFCL